MPTKMVKQELERNQPILYEIYQKNNVNLENDDTPKGRNADQRQIGKRRSSSSMMSAGTYNTLVKYYMEKTQNSEGSLQTLSERESELNESPEVKRKRKNPFDISDNSD